MPRIEIKPNAGPSTDLVKDVVPMVGDEISWKRWDADRNEYTRCCGIVKRRKFLYDNGEVIRIYVEKQLVSKK